MTIEPERFIEALARFPSGVTVIAARHEGETRGMTASAFASLSLHPPLIMTAVDEAANCLRVLEQAGRFVVNVLSEDQEDLASHFAGKPCEAYLETSPFRIEGDPILDESLIALTCRVWACYPGGDHRIVVGEVEDATIDESRWPLAFWNRDFRRLKR